MEIGGFFLFFAMSCSSLALGAVEGGTVGDQYSLDGGAALMAGLVFSAIDIEFLFEIARFAVVVKEIA